MMQSILPKPRGTLLLYVPLNAPHSPLHSPPENLLREPLSDDASDLEKYEAMIEAMDFEIGRVFQSIPLRCFGEYYRTFGWR